ncbi:MAG: lactonase family protein [Alphaproteobacteria bacterium]|nr:lactonase family protein [Alphaproteobacteria bacterium]
MTLRTIVYVSHADGREVFVMKMDPETGDLALLEKVPVTGVAMPMAVSPDRRYLFVGLRSEPYSVASFRIDPSSGRLSPIATTALPDNFAYIATDRAGRFLLGASYSGNKVAVNPIGPHGYVQERPVQVFGSPPNAHCILADPSNRFVYAPCLGGNVILQLKFDAATGIVVPNDPHAAPAAAPGAGPRHIAFHPNNAFLYLLNELDGTASMYAADATSGILSLRQTLDAKPPGLTEKPSAADVHITPNGRFLYGTVRGSNTIAGFAVDPLTGLLTLIDHWPTEGHPRGFNICPRGRFLYAVGLTSHHLQSYRIDADSGKLTPLKRLAMGQGPNWVEILDLP